MMTWHPDVDLSDYQVRSQDPDTEIALVKQIRTLKSRMEYCLKLRNKVSEIEVSQILDTIFPGVELNIIRDGLIVLYNDLHNQYLDATNKYNELICVEKEDLLSQLLPGTNNE